VLEVGLDDYLGAGGVVAIEWAEKFPALLPAGTRWFRFESGDATTRIITESDGKP